MIQRHLTWMKRVTVCTTTTVFAWQIYYGNQWLKRTRGWILLQGTFYKVYNSIQARPHKGNTYQAVRPASHKSKCATKFVVQGVGVIQGGYFETEVKGSYTWKENFVVTDVSTTIFDTSSYTCTWCLKKDKLKKKEPLLMHLFPPTRTLVVETSGQSQTIPVGST